VIFEWDPKKNEINIQKHFVSFEEAETVFEDEFAITLYDDAHSENEERFKVIGVSKRERELMVCHCLRNGDKIIRIITARRANKEESDLYNRR